MTHASLFSGIGGFDYAAALLGWINIFDCEIDAFCRKVLEYHFPNSVHYGDITKQIFKEWRGKSMCFPEDSLASLSAWPDKEKEWMITVTSGLKCSGLYGKSGQLGSLVRMLLESSRWYSPVRRLKWEAGLSIRRGLPKKSIAPTRICYRNHLSRP